MRRSLFQLIAGMPMAGDGLVRPQNAPPAGSTPIGVTPGASSPVVVANRVILIGPGAEIIGPDFVINQDGEFFYSPSPGPGNLSASVVPGTSTVLDPFGNVALPGESVYQTPLALNSPAMSMQQATLIWYAWNGIGWGIAVTIDWTLASGFLEFLGAPLRSLSGTRANPTIISTDSWSAFSAFGAGFQAGGFTPAQVLMPAGPDNAGVVKLRGQILSTAATAANSTMCVALGAPAQNMSWVTPTNAGGYAPAAGSLPRVVTVDTAGNVRLIPATTAAAQFVLLDGIEIPLS